MNATELLLKQRIRELETELQYYRLVKDKMLRAYSEAPTVIELNEVSPIIHLPLQALAKFDFDPETLEYSVIVKYPMLDVGYYSSVKDFGKYRVTEIFDQLMRVLADNIVAAELGKLRIK